MSRQYFSHLLGRVRAGTDAEVYIVPIGEVLYELDQRMQAGQVSGYASIESFYRDQVHASLTAGRFTAANTVYATLFADNPAGLTTVPHYGAANSYTPELYAAIQSATWSVVTADASTTGVPEPTAGLLIAATGLLLARRHRATAA